MNKISQKGFQMTTYLIGLIKVAKQGYRKDKEGVLTYHTEVTVMSEGVDKNGELDINLSKIQLPIDDLTKLKSSVGKYILVPYKTITAKSGTYTFPDDDLPYIIYDKDPLNVDKK